MSGDQRRRIVIQAHALRAKASERAARHGGDDPRSEAPFVRLLLIAVAIAFATVTGLIAAEFIIDLLASRGR